MRPETRLLRDPACLLALGFGLGLLPWMPGTFGGLLAFPLLWTIGTWPIQQAMLLVGVMSAAGIYICGRAGRLLGVEDHGSIVWDEICGAAIAMLTVPPSWGWWVAAFLLFRVFDIVKPWPVGWLDQNLPGGYGVMMDDLAAGAMAGISLIVVRLLFFM